MHRWHVDGDTLYQHCLATGADELFQQFETKITRIRASGGHCIVQTSNIGNSTLWKCLDRCELISDDVGIWIATPKRVVYRTYNDESIWVDDFETNTRVIRNGTLYYASDSRIIYFHEDGRKWQNGDSADNIKSLSIDDEVVYL